MQRYENRLGPSNWKLARPSSVPAFNVILNIDFLLTTEAGCNDGTKKQRLPNTRHDNEIERRNNKAISGTKVWQHELCPMHSKQNITCDESGVTYYFRVEFRRLSVHASVRASVCPCVRASVCPCVRASVRPCVRACVRPSVRTSVRPSVRLCARDMMKQCHVNQLKTNSLD